MQWIGRTTWATLAALMVLGRPLAAQAGFQDPLLDRLIGSWVLEGTIAGEQVTHDLVFEWVLGHQYVQFHEVARERDADGVVVRRDAPELTGPWSAPDTVFVPPQGRFPNILVYQGKAHPYLEGGALVVTYCTNSTDFADHLTEPWLYFPRFARVRTEVSP